MDSRKRLVMFAKGYLPTDGGIERYSTELARAYAKQGWRLYVLTQSSAEPGIRRDGAVTVLDFGKGQQAMLLLRFTCAWRVLRKRLRPDFIHATTWRLALPALLNRRQQPLVVTVHGREIFIVSPLLRIVMRYVFARVDSVVVVSDVIRRLAASQANLITDNWTVVWNGVSLNNDHGFTPHPPVMAGAPVRLLSLCRLVPRKNILGAVRAMALLVESGMNGFIYEIAGNGPDYDAIQALINKRGLKPYVRLLGRVDDADMPALYHAADIFLHPQIDLSGDVEGFGLTIADAMSFGAAVVAGRDGGPADFVIDGATGLLVDGTKDTEIAKAIKLLIDNPALRTKLGEAAERWVHDHLSWSAAAERIIETLPDARSKPVQGTG
ncbi:glycosyltransferase family 4 protein [Beijerinckia indica]|uniref:Glycosyl transferase group 1 n=1 Tax=Beijerinckia indica subsp. indica (strain ATCC 9039 / DSM 1715 / NCIMB 8712) TaxID=395963 RepID=B2ILP2_BEII9|nr:glycosyltransferase family 4 protein [Beijerinckia indica]ACB97442.1 glycosyl transferase group 1 [Beijerinckia indica subsp. indica ATCC 9039]